MQNTPDAQILSSCYADGIGTIYFDCVNGFTGYKDSKISVEVAYGVWKTNEAGFVESRVFPDDIEFYADGTPVPPDEAGAHEITVDVDGNLVTNEYGRCAWVRANMTGKYWSGSEYDIAVTDELKLELPLDGQSAGNMENFYRIWTPIQDATINPHLAQYCRGPMRFRIKRIDNPVENSWRFQDGDLDGANISGQSAAEAKQYNALILIDNVIASFPAMKAEAVARGEYAKDLTDRANVGWIDVLSTRCPAAGETDLKVRAGLIVSSNTPPEQAINYDASTWVTEATWVYRWRYLDQVTNDWQEVKLTPGANGLESTETITMESRVGDIEFYYNAELNAPYYGYVDYSGTGKGVPGYTERIKGVQARFNPESLGQGGIPATLPSLGSDFYLRLREGKSDQLSYRLEIRRPDAAEITTGEFYLTGNNTWRCLHETPTNEAALGTWQFRVIGVNPANCWGGNAVTEMPVTGQRLFQSASAEDCWTSFNVDGATGYLMFQLVEDPLVADQMSYSIVHADFQDFTHWNSAKKEYYVGTYTDNEKKTGASSAAKEYPGELLSWAATSAENDALWTEKFYPGASALPESGYDGYPAYSTFPSAYTPNGWEAGQGMWVCANYRKSVNGGDMALQMEGQGRGYLTFNNASSAPHGLESVSFKARVAQFGTFREFSYYQGKQISTMKDYLFTTKVIMAENANKTGDYFDGSGTVSLLGYYQPNEGGYEVRAERVDSVDSNSIRLSIYKWYYSGGQIVSKEVCRSKTGIAFTSQSYLQKHGSGYYGEMFVHCITESDRTIVVGGLLNGALGLSSSASGKNHFLVKFEDTAADRLKYGTCGFNALNCPAQFINPLYYSGIATYGNATWTRNSDAAFKDYLAYYQSKSITFPGSSTSMFLVSADTSTYADWAIDRGKFEKLDVSSLRALKSVKTENTIEVQIMPSGTSRWQTIGTTNIVGFGLTEYTFPIYSKDDATVRLRMGGTIYDVRSDVVIDDVKLKQWRGESYDESSVNFPNEKLPTLGCPSNYVYLTSWINEDGDVRTIDLQPMRARASDLIGIRAPLMDGYDGRGIGLGMFSFSYENADSNCVLKLQYAPMNGTSYLKSFTESVDTNIWTDVTTWAFSNKTDKVRASGTLSHYLGMHGFQGVMRLIVEPQVVADSQDATKNQTGDLNYGKITITSFLTRDEPVLDDRSWWGWNLRSSDAPAERILYDGVASEARLALALNNSVTDDLDPNEDTHALYEQHVPFVQSPTFGTNIVGEINFKARKLNPTDGDAVIAILGARDGGVTVDSEWVHLKSFIVSNAFYETFSYKTDPGQDYGSFRVAVIGVDGVTQNYLNRVPDGAAPLRVLIDEVVVSEAIRARIGFRDVAAFRSGLEHDYMISNVTDKAEQPLCKESWGVQCEVFIAQLEDEVDKERGFDVRLHWFDGTNPWGFENWKTNAAAKSAWLARAKGTDAWVFRSGYLSAPEAVIPPSMKATTVQYMLEVQYYSASGAPVTNFLTAADWNEGRGPAWYSPVNYNSGRDFSAYNILDTVSPGWAWINEVNVFGVYDRNWMNSDENRQYVEVAMPAEADLTGWQLKFLDASVQSGVIYTNTVATFGTVALPGTKPNLKNMASNCVFMVVGCPGAAKSGSLSKADGELDGVWSFQNKSTSAFSSSETVVPTYPIGVQLVRPSGIVEHEILMIGTNFWEGTGNEADMFKPDEYVDFFNASEKGGRFFFAGSEKGGEECSLSVLTGSGATSNDWSHAVVRTPGRINVGQAINPLHPTPFGSAIMIYSNLGSSGKLSQMIGGVPVKQNEIIILRKGTGEGTNLVYVADTWYEMGSVKVDGVSTPWTALAAPRTYSVNVGAGSSNDMITVDAEAVMQKNLETDYGLTPENRYTGAIMDWLSKGTDIYGNAWANPASGEIKLAEYWPWNGDESMRQTLPLTVMYWLDIDPTAGGWVFRAGTTDIAGPYDPSTDAPVTAASSVTNIRLSVSMMITNKNSNVAHAPYTLRGLEPGSSSHAYDPVTSDYGWTSVTFKVTGIMLNTLTDESNRENRVPLRWLVFGEDSFGGADGFTATIDVRDPWAKDSPASNYGYQDWLKNHGTMPTVGYAWDIDERLKPISVDKLKADSTY